MPTFTPPLSPTFAEGWDFPACRTLILARPTKSRIRYLQMVGRVLRTFPGKDRALVLDHSGSVKRLGFPTDDLPLVLNDGKPQKPGASRDKEPPLPKPCPSCKFLKPAKVHTCPKCGFAPERKSDVDVSVGELVKGEQHITVQHVTVANGGQAIVGNLTNRGRGSE